MFASRIALPVVALVLLQAGYAWADEEIYRRALPSTVLVYTNQGPQPGSNGTGFLIDAKERLVVTCRHVIENPTGGMYPYVAVIFAQKEEGETITDVAHYQKNWDVLAIRCKVVYESVRRDLAILQLEKLPPGLIALKLAERPPRPGKAVDLVGNSIESYGGAFGYCHGYVRMLSAGTTLALAWWPRRCRSTRETAAAPWSTIAARLSVSPRWPPPAGRCPRPASFTTSR